MPVLAFVNSMGGTPLAELYVVSASWWRCAGAPSPDRPVTHRAVYTSLEMQGVSITLLQLDDELTELVDDPC